MCASSSLTQIDINFHLLSLCLPQLIFFFKTPHIKAPEEARANFAETSSRGTTLSPDSSAICMRLLHQWNLKSSRTYLTPFTRATQTHTRMQKQPPHPHLFSRNPCSYRQRHERDMNIEMFSAIKQFERTFLTDKYRKREEEDTKA